MGSKPNERSQKEFSALPLGLFVLCLAATILEVRAPFECPPQNNCEQCEANGTCITCSSGYGYQPSTALCEPCGADCLECSPIGGNCTQCKVGFGPDFSSGNASCGRCVTANCDSGCSERGAGKCDRCNFEYGPNPTFTQCTHCIANCRVCVMNTSYCDSCNSGYAVYDPGNRTCGACSQYCTMNGCFLQGPGLCDKCDPGYEYYRNTFVCGPCTANCSSCVVNGAGQCDNCTFGYGLTPTNTCAPCSANCKVYGCNITGAGKCDKCDVGYGLLPNGSCDKCAANCSSCLVNGAGQCDNCTFGYGLTPTNTCAPCSKYCMTYGCFIAGAGYCDKCDPGYLYFRNNKTCGDCAANCSSCLVNGAGQCDNCTLGYGLTPNNTCGPCASNCTIYKCAMNGADKCDRCDPGFTLTATNSCASCSPNCNASVGCNVPNTCLGCNFGYGLLLPNETCNACGDNCNVSGCQSNGAGKCDKCDPGYELTSANSCLPITTTRLASTTPIQATTTPIQATTTPIQATTTPIQATTSTRPTVASTITIKADMTTVSWSTVAVMPTAVTGGSIGSGGDVSSSQTPVTPSIDVSGMTMKGSSSDSGSGSGSSVSGVVANTASPSPAASSQSNDLDWRVLLTLMLLIFGGLFITLSTAAIWMARFSPASIWIIRRFYPVSRRSRALVVDCTD